MRQSREKFVTLGDTSKDKNEKTNKESSIKMTTKRHGSNTRREPQGRNQAQTKSPTKNAPHYHNNNHHTTT